MSWHHLSHFLQSERFAWLTLVTLVFILVRALFRVPARARCLDCGGDGLRHEPDGFVDTRFKCVGCNGTGYPDWLNDTQHPSL